MEHEKKEKKHSKHDDCKNSNHGCQEKHSKNECCNDTKSNHGGCKKNHESQEEHSKHEEQVSKKEYNHLKEMLLRHTADFQNYQKRTEQEKSKFIKLSNEELIKKIIPIIDNFELALKHSKEENEFTEGMSLIYNQLIEVLEHEGLEKIPAIGKFDPKKHEVLMMEESEKEEGQIIQELQKGYVLGDKIIRTSKVKISKKTKQEVQ